MTLDHVSHSQIEMWLRCPRQWEFRYVKGLRLPPGGALIVGHGYHEALEMNFRYKLKNEVDMDVEDCLDCFSDSWEAEVERWKGQDLSIDWGDDDPGVLKDTGLKIVHLYRTTEAPQIVPVSVERQYSLNLGGVRFVGSFDLETVDVDVIDHKTSAKSYNQQDVDKALQPSAHAFALGRELNYQMHVAVKTARPHIQKVTTERTLDDVVWWLDLAFSVVEAMKLGICPPNPNGWWCGPKWCGFWDLCKGG